jgi:sortase A
MGAQKSRTAASAPMAGVRLTTVQRAGRILSIALVTAGVVVLLDVGLTVAYREPVSSIYGALQQNAAEGELEDIESSAAVLADLRETERVMNPRRRARLLAEQFAERAEPGKPIGRIEAPAMDGLDAVVIEGTSSSALQEGPGRYPGTAFPGQGRTIGVAGHRTTYGAPFRHVDSMKAGDEVTLEMPYATFVYEVQRTEIVDPSQTEVVRDVGYERLVLSACHPLYSAAQRYIVFARLTRVRVSDSAER